MIIPRLLFLGDVAEAAKYAGVARNLALNTYQAGIMTKIWHVTREVSIRVINYREANICKVWIEASSNPVTVDGYQFYTTSPNVQWAIDTDAVNDFYPGGSAIFVPTPKEIAISGTPTYVIRALTKGSLVEVPPTVNGVPLWDYSPMPDYLVGEDQLNQKMQTELFRVKGAWQIDGTPQYVYYRCEGETLVTKPVVSVFQSWTQAKGQVHGCGAIVPIDYRYSTDFQYDAAPTDLTRKSRIEYQVPDTDWFGRGTVQSVTHPLYGTRLFFITSDTQGVWHCYPLSGVSTDVGEYAAEYALYGDQGYKANIIPEQVQTDTPAYPDWVSPGVSWRDLYVEDPDRLILEPRYSWSFNQTGTRAISVMVERKDSVCTFAEVDYAPNGLGTAVYNALTSLDDPVPFDDPHIPTEESLDDILIDQSDNLGKSSDPRSVQQDRRGWVELEFLVELTGADLEDFTFEVSVIHEYSPDDLLALGHGVLVDVAYAMPMQWDFADFGVRNLTDSTFSVQTDDVLSTWIKLYRHQEQIDLIGAYDGEVSMNEPSKAKAFFYKGATPEALSSLFVLPLYQAHGNGYTFAIDPALPPDPHLFVRQTCQSFTSRYPWAPEEGESPELYTYDAQITHLDLRSLSFYYTVRLLEQTHDAEAHDITGGIYIRNKAKKWCAVCVMGKIVQEESVGHEDLPVNWIQGWALEAGAADLDEDEFLTPPDLTGNLRGCGFIARNTVIEYLPPTIPAGTTAENYFMGSDSWGKKSWVNTVYMQASPYRNRAQYTNSYLDELPVPPWFMIGPCGHLFNYALYLCLCEQQFSGTTIEQESGFVESTFNFSSFMPIDSITEEDVPDFIGFVYDLFSAYSMSYVIVDSGITIYDEERTFGDLYAQNPLSLASPDLTALAFTANASGYVWKLIQSVQKYTAYLAGDAETTIGNLWGFVAALPTYIDHFAFPRGGGVVQYKNQNRLIDPVSNATTHEQFRKQKIVKEFELGNLYYNTAIVRHFTPSPMHANDAIQITPEGHYSFNRRDLFEISKQFCTQDVKYYNDKLNYSGAGLYNFSTGAMPLILRYEPIPAQGLTASDVDWKLLEGLHWFYGEVKTTHLAVYNLAYQQVAPADRKPYLLSEEDYQSWYSAADFKPDFQFLSYNNYLWVYPGDAEDGQPITAIYRSLGSTHNTSTLLYPKFDGRSQRSSLRLSPLFFS